jgi:hypothetical protein
MTAPTTDEVTQPPEHRALADALAAVLLPLARLAVARGLPYAAAEEQFKQAFVQAAREAQPEPGASRMVSRISTATGINRREVTRLIEGEKRATTRPRSLAAEVFAHWTTAPEYRDRRGLPRTLPRQTQTAGELSFETLAQSITRDVHPRSLLDELVRLGLATLDHQADTVTLERDAFVPRGDAIRMLGFLGDNVGDHLSAAVENVLNDGEQHFEQAVFAGEMSSASMEQVKALVRSQWQVLIEATVPLLEKMIEDDRQQERSFDRRLRIGLYTFNESLNSSSAAEMPPAARKARRSTKEQS